MNRSSKLREQWLDFLYVCRAIFHAVFVKGGSLPFYDNCIMKVER